MNTKPTYEELLKLLEEKEKLINEKDKIIEKQKNEIETLKVKNREINIKLNDALKLLEEKNCRLSFCMQPITNNIIKINEESPSNNLAII